MEIQFFAQTDVIITFLFGINEYFDNKINSIFNYLKKRLNSNKQINNDTLTIVLKEIAIVKNFFEYESNDFKNYFLEMKNLSLSPILKSIGFLLKEDLSNIAEYLIYITSLKRKISNDLETVGGSIDVAIISKGDGNIWKKFESYYDVNLNSHFNKC